MNENKKTIFLSHSTKDNILANALYTLFYTFIKDNDLEYDIFYAPESLTDFDKYSRKWKDGITTAVKNCSVFVVLWTPNSIENRWVNYEVGIAQATGKTIISIGVNGINFNLIIPNEIQILFLNSPKNIKRVLSNLFKIRMSLISSWATKDGYELIENVSNLSRTQCVFFAGSIQEGNSDELEKFVTQLSDKLLNAGFKLASYPTVPHIGEIVAQRAIDCDVNKYEIAGLYKFDDDISLFTNKWGGNLNDWNATIDSFREIYLQNKDCMIIIGGGKYTKSEYKVARHITKLQIFPIPCFGGTGKEIYEKISQQEWFSMFKHPCANCNMIRENGECPHLNEFVKRLEERIIITKE